MADKNFDNVRINVEFEEPTDREALSSGEDIKSLFGKIKKYFTDMKLVAFSGSYNDLGDKPIIPTVTNDLTDELKSDLDELFEVTQISSKPIWENAGFNSANGNIVANNTRLLSNYISDYIEDIHIKDTNCQYVLIAFDNETYIGEWNGSTFEKTVSWHTSDIVLTYIRNIYPNYKFRLMLAYTDNAVIAESDVDNILIFNENSIDKKVNSINKKMNEINLVIYGSEEELKDISDLFVFEDGGSIISNNSTALGSEVFCYTPEYIDIQAHAGKKMSITTLVYTTAEGKQPINGFAIYDSNKTELGFYQTNKGDKAIEITEIMLPINAYYIRSTFFIDSKPSFSCIVSTEKEGTLLYEIAKTKEDIETLKTAIGTSQKRDYTEGDIHFTVKASQFDGTKVDTECVLRLPSSYNPNGEPTPIILNGHGTNGMVSSTSWYSDNQAFHEWVQYLCDSGFAVFDVDNVYANHTSGEKFEFGCPQLLNAYHEAFEYIKSNYNVESQLCIIGASQGSFTAVNYQAFFANDVKMCVISGPRIGLEWEWALYGSLGISTLFGYESTEYNSDYLKPFDIYTHISDNGYLTSKFCPSMWVFGGDDNIHVAECDSLIDALKNSGYYAEKKVYSGLGHSDVTKPSDEQVRTDILRFLKMFN